MQRLLVASALVAVVAVAALAFGRRQRSDAPSQPRRWPVPAQLDRADFEAPGSPWLGALFTSATCDSCSRIEQMVLPLASPSLAITVLPWQEHKALHERYGVEAVPCFVLADDEGVVRYGFVGRDMTATDLWAAVAEARSPGSTPEDPDRPDPL